MIAWYQKVREQTEEAYLKEPSRLLGQPIHSASQIHSHLRARANLTIAKSISTSLNWKKKNKDISHELLSSHIENMIAVVKKIQSKWSQESFFRRHVWNRASSGNWARRRIRNLCLRCCLIATAHGYQDPYVNILRSQNRFGSSCTGNIDLGGQLCVSRAGHIYRPLPCVR